MPDVHAVEVADGLKEEFLKEHRKDLDRAGDAWEALVDLAPKLRNDPFHGTHIPKDRFPPAYDDYDNLWKLDLPHAFRALYSVLGRPGGGVRVAIDWIGDHGEYERLFGYG